jgi:hypothetical protein
MYSREDGLMRYYGAKAKISKVKGKAALALSRDLGTSYKTTFVLAHKIHEAMATEFKGMRVGGQGETVEIDGERGGSTLPAVFKTEGALLAWIGAHVAKGTTLVADEAPSWNPLHGRYEVSRIDHGQA